MAEIIFDEVNSRTEKEARKKLELLPETQVQKTHGFKVVILNPQKIKVKSWIAAKTRFLADIRKELEVKPLAIAHLHLWSELSKKMGLFRLTVNKEGGVNADKGALEEITNTASSKLKTRILQAGMYAFGGLILGLLMGAFIGIPLSEISDANDIIAEFLMIIATSSCIGGMTGIALSIWTYLKAKNKLRQQHADLHILFPNMRSLPARTGTNIAIDFVDPPENIQSLLLKLQKAHCFDELQVVAHPDAFSVDPSKQVMAWADPIITIVRGDCVAVLAQYGDFPQEIRLEEIISSLDFLPIE
ncbi:MAG: hypothetical protein UW95_C0014G0003 [Parcubacteria group bacterium GW2011_GWC1_45_14]|nr:MAG: hypothetical protein UW95_C0014G0003 [Parcubacteria group bacterium GW2011_GWC1_45_14]